MRSQSCAGTSSGRPPCAVLLPLTEQAQNGLSDAPFLRPEVDVEERFRVWPQCFVGRLRTSCDGSIRALDNGSIAVIG